MTTAPLRVVLAVVALPLAVAASSAWGADEAPVAALPEPLAVEAAQAAIASCAASGYTVAVSIVDAGGNLRQLLAADGAPQRAIDSSTAKAYTVIKFAQPSGEIAKRVAADPAFAAQVAADPRLRARAGGLALKKGGALAGAIGVGGAPGGEKDELCATAGIDRIRDRLE